MKSRHPELKNTKITDSFWSGIQELVRNSVIPYQYEAINDRIEGAEKSYSVENFVKAGKIAAALREGKSVPVYPADKWVYDDNNADKNAFHGWVFQDSDVYKWLEAAAYSLSCKPDYELEKRADGIIDLVCAAQLENGYLDTLYIINNRDEIFTNLKDFHELYCFGHLAEAAVAYYNSTGKDKLLNAALRFADLICKTFGESGIKGYPGHEIAELALVKLYEITGEKRYLKTAEFFIEERGKKPYYYDIVLGRKTVDDNYHYNQAHIQPKYQREAVGHAVRGVYLYSGMADIVRHTDDAELYSACKALAENIINKKMYITGGIGATVDGEAFSFNYDLPNDLAYAETCASIGFIFFARRMLEIEPNTQIAAAAERALYNTVLSGMSEDGTRFFYVNPLEVLPEASHKDSRKRHIKPVRQKWFGCACCPPNLARLISSLGEYALTENESAVYIHQYVGGEYRTENGAVIINSDYSESGRVNFTITPERAFTLALRIPDWCDKFSISAPYKTKDGYALVDITEKCEILIEFEIKPRLVKCSNLVRANIGKAAVMRGPFVYCIEGADNGENLQLLSLSPKSALKYENGIITADGFREEPDGRLYREYKPAKADKTKITFIPYYKWGNRGENEMQVYIGIKN